MITGKAKIQESKMPKKTRVVYKSVDLRNGKKEESGSLLPAIYKEANSGEGTNRNLSRN